MGKLFILYDTPLNAYVIKTRINHVMKWFAVILSCISLYCIQGTHKRVYPLTCEVLYMADPDMKKLKALQIRVVDLRLPCWTCLGEGLVPPSSSYMVIIQNCLESNAIISAIQQLTT